MAEAGTITIIENIGEVKLGDIILPGIYQSLEISRAVRMDEKQVPGRSGSSKQPLGFEDAEVTLELVLTNDHDSSARDKLRIITGLFQATDRQARPLIYTIAHPVLADWGIRYVVFQSLKSRDDNLYDLVYCSLKFVEHVPVTTKAERRRKPAVVTDVKPATLHGMVLYETSDVFEINPYSVPNANVEDFYKYGTGRPKTVDAAKVRASVDDDVVK